MDLAAGQIKDMGMDGRQI